MAAELQHRRSDSADEAGTARTWRNWLLQLLCLLYAAFVTFENGGLIIRAWSGASMPAVGLGAAIAEPDAADRFVRIEHVDAGGPMNRAGVVAGDRVRFDRPYDRIRQLRAGETVGFTLAHAGHSTRLQVTASAVKAPPAPSATVEIQALFYLAETMGTLIGAFIIWRSQRRATPLLLGMALVTYSVFLIFPWPLPPAVFTVVYILSSCVVVLPTLFYAFGMRFYGDCVGPAKAWEKAAFWAYATVAALVGAVVGASRFYGAAFPIVGTGIEIEAAVLGLGLAICLAYLILGWRRSVASVRQRYALMLVATSAISLALVLDVLGPLIRSAEFDLAHHVVNAILAGVIGSGLYAYSILRHRVLDLGFALNRTLVYAFVSVILLAAFGLIEWAIERFVPIQGREQNALVDAGVAVVVFLAFHRVRDVVEHVIERLFFRRWQRAEAELRRFVKEAAFFAEAPKLIQAFVQALSAYAEGAPAAVYFAEGRGYARAAGDFAGAPAQLAADIRPLVSLRADPKPVELHDDALNAALIAPMVNRNEVIGLAVLGRKPSGLDFRPDEVELIGWATRQVGLDLHALKVEQLEIAASALRQENATLRSLVPTGATPAV